MIHQWTTEQRDIIRDAYEQAIANGTNMADTAMQLSQRLGRTITKNGVVGLAFRNNWVGRPKRIAKPAPPLARPKTCQYLDGKPADRNFCGDPIWAGTSYCEHHATVCFTPSALERIANDADNC